MKAENSTALFLDLDHARGHCDDGRVQDLLARSAVLLKNQAAAICRLECALNTQTMTDPTPAIIMRMKNERIRLEREGGMSSQYVVAFIDKILSENFT